MEKKYLIILGILFFNLCIFSENNSIIGIWENGGRFIEFSNEKDENLDMRIVLKPYYKFVYDDVLKCSVNYSKVKNSNSQFYLRITYPFVRKNVILPVCIENNCFFTSFYKRMVYTINDNEPSLENSKSFLYGFWIEQGNQRGILLHPNEIPKSIDAYFFTDTKYIKFRYWLDDLVYNDDKAVINGEKNSYKVPKFLKRGNLVYSCITSNGKILRNFEKGIYSINKDINTGKGSGLLLSLERQGSGPGSHSVADTYPNPQFSEMENLPLYLLDNNLIFAIGSPYLFKSDIMRLDEEIQKHNENK